MSRRLPLVGGPPVVEARPGPLLFELPAPSITVHGDGPAAASFVMALEEGLRHVGVVPMVAALGQRAWLRELAAEVRLPAEGATVHAELATLPSNESRVLVVAGAAPGAFGATLSIAVASPGRVRRIAAVVDVITSNPDPRLAARIAAAFSLVPPHTRR